jgi:hypothetical protein
MRGEVEISQAEVDLKALEGFLVGNQDLERLDALLDRFNIFEATGWYWGGHKDEGCQGIQAPQRIERDGELYHRQESGVRGDRARLSSRLHLHGWLLR